MTAKTTSEQPSADKPSIATGAPRSSAPTEASLKAAAPGKYRVFRRNRQLTPFDESKIRVVTTNKASIVMTALVFSVFCSEAEAGCVAESGLYVEQPLNISKQAEPCAAEQENDVRGELVLPGPMALYKPVILPEPNTHDRVKAPNDRPQDGTATNQSPEESTTGDGREFMGNHWGTGISIFALMLLFFRETLRAGSILAAFSTVIG